MLLPVGPPNGVSNDFYDVKVNGSLTPFTSLAVRHREDSNARNTRIGLQMSRTRQKQTTKDRRN